MKADRRPSEEQSNEAWRLLPTCGCGDPDAIAELTHWTLAMFFYKQGFEGSYEQSPEHRFKIEVLGMDGAGSRATMFWIFLAALDDKGLLEHGVSIRQSWLTEKGKWLLGWLQANGTATENWWHRRSTR